MTPNRIGPGFTIKPTDMRGTRRYDPFVDRGVYAFARAASNEEVHSATVNDVTGELAYISKDGPRARLSEPLSGQELIDTSAALNAKIMESLEQTSIDDNSNSPEIMKERIANAIFVSLKAHLDNKFSDEGLVNTLNDRGDLNRADLLIDFLRELEFFIEAAKLAEIGFGLETTDFSTLKNDTQKRACRARHRFMMEVAAKITDLSHDYIARLLQMFYEFCDQEEIPHSNRPYGITLNYKFEESGLTISLNYNSPKPVGIGTVYVDGSGMRRTRVNQIERWSKL